MRSRTAATSEMCVAAPALTSGRLFGRLKDCFQSDCGAALLREGLAVAVVDVPVRCYAEIRCACVGAEPFTCWCCGHALLLVAHGVSSKPSTYHGLHSFLMLCMARMWQDGTQCLLVICESVTLGQARYHSVLLWSEFVIDCLFPGARSHAL